MARQKKAIRLAAIGGGIGGGIVGGIAASHRVFSPEEIAQAFGFVLFVGIFVSGPGILAVATERSQRRLTRPQYASRLLGLVCYGAVVTVALRLIDSILGPTFEFTLINILAFILFFVGYPLGVALFHRVIVQRARDAGHGKLLPYIAVVPPVGLAIALLYLFKKSVPRHTSVEVFD